MRIISALWLLGKVLALRLLYRLGVRGSVDRWAMRLLTMQQKGMWSVDGHGGKKTRKRIPRIQRNG